MKPGTLPAIAYLIFGLLGVLLLAPAMPPFQNPDEAAHSLRADQISHFGLLARKFPNGEQGGLADSGINAAAAPFQALPFAQSAKVVRAFYAPQSWGSLVPAGFPNTAIYPPPFYVPAAVALFIARHANLTVLQGMELARFATGLVTVAIGTLAIWLCDGASLWVYTILLLPMSLALTAAISQDGPMLACTALAAALLRKLRGEADPRLLICLVLLLALVGAARPPHAGFALLLLLLPLRLSTRLIAIAAVIACIAGWSVLMAPHVVFPVFPDGAVSPRAQLSGLIQSPLRLLTILYNTWQAHSAEIAGQFIGKLGWLDVDLPHSYVELSWLILALAAFTCLAPGRWKMPSSSACTGALGIVITIVGIFAAQFLTWTVPGHLIVEGVQGRYFLPPAVMLAALFPLHESTRSWPGQARWAILAFPIVTLPVVVHALILRYYL